jgi:hypothetical protein
LRVVKGNGNRLGVTGLVLSRIACVGIVVVVLS